MQLLTKQRQGLQSGIVVFKHTQINQLALYKHLLKNHVVCAMRGDGIRFSAHYYNSTAEIDKAIALIPEN